MGRKIKVIDPRTGRSLILIQKSYPVAKRRTYPPPAVYRQQLKKVRTHYARKYEQAMAEESYRRSNRAVVVGSCILWFGLSWVPCAFGWPGATILIWFFLFAYIVGKAIKS